MNSAPYPVFSIGHSNHSPDEFIALLKQHSVHEVADVRSSPYSRYTTQFNQALMEKALEAAGISYMFLGAELGGRPADQSCYDANGRVLYERIANTDLFEDGLAYLIRNADDRRIAIMCTEKDPLDCHRTLLIARALVERGIDVEHVLADGSLENHHATMSRLVDALKLPPYGDLFRTKSEVVADALRIQESKVAYVSRRPAQSDTEWWDGF